MGLSQKNFKALLAGLTNQHDMSDSFAVTPLPKPHAHLRNDPHACSGHGHLNAGSLSLWLQTTSIGAGVIYYMLRKRNLV